LVFGTAGGAATSSATATVPTMIVLSPFIGAGS
jgi:hypothetical protein